MDSLDNASWIFSFQIQGEAREKLLSQLAIFPFNGFLEEEEALQAYLPAHALHTELEAAISLLAKNYACEYTRTFLAAQNWNASWEADFHPIRVGNFVGVRAEFHPPFTDVAHDLLIHPRMAFGTGHHATTLLMMERMQQLQWTGKSVFDYGCGTGILAILAKRLGAGYTDAVDIEAPATENTLVNMQANGVEDITVFTGDLSTVPGRNYDIILANINRQVILDSLAALYQRSTTGGDLLVSGVLQQDQELVLSTARTVGWQLEIIRKKEGWLLLHFRR